MLCCLQEGTVSCAGNVSESDASEAVKAGLAGLQMAETHRKRRGLCLHCSDPAIIMLSSKTDAYLHTHACTF